MTVNYSAAVFNIIYKLWEEMSWVLTILILIVFWFTDIKY